LHDNETGSAPDEVPTRLRMDIAYDGTNFAGWAVQPGQRTVEGLITDALQRIYQRVVKLTVAGRTDAGVHATGQVCHVDLPAMPGLASAMPGLARRLNRLLEDDVRIIETQVVSNDFDARFSAIFRRYEYRVTETPNPLRRLDTLAWPRPLSEDRMNEAAARLQGEHDFAAYCRRKEMATTIREVMTLQWRRDADGVLVATVQADAFCQQMVRSLVGAMLAVGEGRREPGWPASLLQMTERASEVPVAPAHGLTLVAVGYPPEHEYRERAEQTRNLRTRLG
jgi:tRNA pseudouridine38-40 synthase